MPANQNSGYTIRFIKLWLPVLVCMGIIFYSSCIPGKDIPSIFTSQEILFHALTYGVMAYFFARALKNTYARFSLFKIIGLAVIFGIVYGFSDEFHQIFVPGRCASGFDLFIDGVGSFLGSLIHR